MSRPLERITQAAIHVFREQGVNDARMEDIARIAKLSRPNLYRYIQDRDDLIRLVILQRASAFRHELRILPGNWMDALVDLFTRVVRLSAEDEIFMLMIHEAEPAVAKLFNDDDRIRTSLNKVIEPLLARGRAAGEIRDDLSDEDILLWLHYQNWSLTRDPKIQKTIDVKAITRKFVIGGIVKSDAVISDPPVATARTRLHPARRNALEKPINGSPS